MKKLHIFDFDGTLVDSLGQWHKIVDIECFKHFGCKVIKDFYKKRKGKDNLEVVKFFLEITKINASVEDVFAFWDTAMEYHYTHDVKLIKGAKEYLELLHNNGAILHIATATDRSLVVKAIKHLDLEKYFSFVISERDINKSKAEPDVFNECLKNASCSINDAIVYEDSKEGLSCAHNMGIEICCIKNKYKKKYFKYYKSITNNMFNNYLPLLKLNKKKD